MKLNAISPWSTWSARIDLTACSDLRITLFIPRIIAEQFNSSAFMSKYPPAKPGALVCEPLKADNDGTCGSLKPLKGSITSVSTGRF
ncbi:MAG: hypothetical protein WC997_16480, partial [Porticoccaceae bacterium]